GDKGDQREPSFAEKAVEAFSVINQIPNNRNASFPDRGRDAAPRFQECAVSTPTRSAKSPPSCLPGTARRAMLNDAGASIGRKDEAGVAPWRLSCVTHVASQRQDGWLERNEETRT
ncbi:MAG: hypothetical protein KJZ87_21675, partial [Thermoguttaceae bacterium]|nr:hypothetical protein [Thermoguttaceae bacterium]